jgi:glyoxylase-like metal-dependent hydrolase (beta-lactamase superfamily II)
MQIIPIQYAQSVLPESDVFAGGDKGKDFPIVFIVYVVKTQGRTILVDAGCETMPGFDMKNFIKPTEALRAKGIDAADVTDVLITHAHHDHIECVKYFEHAVIHIQLQEYEVGKAYIPDSFAVNLFDEAFSLCEGVRIVKVGGHTDGSCVVELADGEKTIVIVGDECYSRECLKRKIRTGNTRHPEKSMAFIEKYSADVYVALLCHEE